MRGTSDLIRYAVITVSIARTCQRSHHTARIFACNPAGYFATTTLRSRKDDQFSDEKVT